MTNWRSHLAMLTFAALVSGSFALGGRVAVLVDPAALMAARFLIASIVIALLVLAGPGIKRQDLRASWRYLVLGGLFAIYFVLMFEGLKTASPVSTAAVFTLTPVMSAVFGWILLRQITTKYMALALLIGGLGAVWVIFRADFNALMQFNIGHGERLFFLGSIAHAIFTPMTRKLNRGEAPLVFLLGGLSATFLILLVWSAPEIIATKWLALPTDFWIILIYLAVFASAATFFLLQYAALKLPSSKVMAYTYLTPSFVILWEGFLHGSWPPLIILIGVAVSGLALIMLLRDR